LKDGVLTINVNNAVKSYGGGNAREEGIINQVLYTMKQIDGVRWVKLLIDGKESELPEGTDIKNNLLVPEFINVKD
jgi:germination protein M